MPKPHCSTQPAPTIAALRERAVRDQHGLFVAEGVRFLSEAAALRVPLEAIVYCPTLLHNAFARRLIRHLRRSGVRCSQLPPESFSALARSEDPQGVLLVARQRWTPLGETTPDAGLCWIALDSVQSPGNFGTIVRTADAVGAGGIIVLGDGPDPFHPASVRASMGAIFNVPLVRASPAEFARWKTRRGAALIGTSPCATQIHFQFDFPPRSILWMGGERKGLSPTQQATCDAVVKIPMAGRSDSLNVAIASGVLLYEVFRQRTCCDAKA